jgi:hypothetical protein
VTRLCPCGAEFTPKPAEAKKAGRALYCSRPCANRYRDQRRPAGPEHPAWRGDLPLDPAERQRAIRAGHYERHHEKIRAQQEKYRRENAETVKAAEKAYREAHPESQRRANERFRKRHPERHRQQQLWHGYLRAGVWSEC